MKNSILRRIKPEKLMMSLLLILILLFIALVGKDYLVKRQIEADIVSLEKIFPEIALNLPQEILQSAIRVQEKFLRDRAPEVQSVTILPNNHIEVVFLEGVINQEPQTFYFSFETVDKLERGIWKCEGAGNLSPRLLPKQCRE